MKSPAYDTRVKSRFHHLRPGDTRVARIYWQYWKRDVLEGNVPVDQEFFVTEIIEHLSNMKRVFPSENDRLVKLRQMTYFMTNMGWLTATKGKLILTALQKQRYLKEDPRF